MVEIAGLSKTIDIGRDVEQLRRERRWREGIEIPDADQQIESPELSATIRASCTHDFLDIIAEEQCRWSEKERLVKGKEDLEVVPRVSPPFAARPSVLIFIHLPLSFSHTVMSARGLSSMAR